MITILDGGMSRELMRLGAPLRQPEWSALALIESPEHVTEAHREFARAGAQVLTTNAYAVVPFHLGEERFAGDGRRLAESAARLCRAVADEFDVRVAGCLPPPLGSYRPEAFDRDESERILKVLVEAQSPFVDLWLAETMSSIAEADVAAAVIADRCGRDLPVWMSFTVDDHDGSRLRSGESVGEAARFAAERGAAAMLFNCSHTDAMETAIRAARSACDLPIGVYPNLFDEVEDTAANEILHAIRTDADGTRYAGWADTWVDAGATMVGGCCGATAVHVAALSAHLTAG